MDYEKAYDYVNRAEIISDLKKKGCGSNMIRAVAKMFSRSTYFPKTGVNSLGEGITTDYGVTQGRRSSGNLFSFYMSDMSSAFHNIDTNDFMDPYNLAQLADDTAFYAEHLENLRLKFQSILSFSAKKYQIPNISKTKYLHFSDNATKEPLIINEDVTIGSVDKKGYKYVGMIFFPTSDINKIIEKNYSKGLAVCVNFMRGWN